MSRHGSVRMSLEQLPRSQRVAFLEKLGSEFQKRQFFQRAFLVETTMLILSFTMLNQIHVFSRDDGSYLEDLLVVVMMFVFLVVLLTSMMTFVSFFVSSVRKSLIFYFLLSLLYLFLALSFWSPIEGEMLAFLGYHVPMTIVRGLLVLFFLAAMCVVTWRSRVDPLEKEVVTEIRRFLRQKPFFRLDMADEIFHDFIAYLKKKWELDSDDAVIRWLLQKHHLKDVEFVMTTVIKEKKKAKVEMAVYFLRSTLKAIHDEISLQVNRFGVMNLEQVSVRGVNIPDTVLRDLFLAKNLLERPPFEVIIVDSGSNKIFLLSNELKEQVLMDVASQIQSSGMISLRIISRDHGIEMPLLLALIEGDDPLSGSFIPEVVIIEEKLLSLSYLEQLLQELTSTVMKKKIMRITELAGDLTVSELTAAIQISHQRLRENGQVRLSCDGQLIYDENWFSHELLDHVNEILNMNGILNLETVLNEQGLPACEFYVVYQKIFQQDDSVMIHDRALVLSKKVLSRKIEELFQQRVSSISEHQLQDHLGVPVDVLTVIIDHFLEVTQLPIVKSNDSRGRIELKLQEEFLHLVKNDDDSLVRIHDLSRKYRLDYMKIIWSFTRVSENRWEMVPGTDLLIKTSTFSSYHPVGNLIDDVKKERLIEMRRIESVFGNAVDGNAVIRHVLLDVNKYMGQFMASTIQLVTVTTWTCDFHGGELESSHPFYYCGKCSSRYCQQCFQSLRAVEMDSCLNCHVPLHRYPQWCARCLLISLPLASSWSSGDDNRCAFCGSMLQHGTFPEIIQAIKDRLNSRERGKVKKSLQIIEQWKDQLDTPLGDLSRDLKEGHPISKERLQEFLENDWRLGIILAWQLSWMSVMNEKGKERLVIVVGNHSVYFQSTTFEQRCLSCGQLLLLKQGYVHCGQCLNFHCKSCASDGCTECETFIYLEKYPLFCSDCPHSVRGFPSLMEEDRQVNRSTCRHCNGRLMTVNQRLHQEFNRSAAVNHAQRRWLNLICDELLLNNREHSLDELRRLLEDMFPRKSDDLLVEIKKKLHSYGYFLAPDATGKIIAKMLETDCQVCYGPLEWSKKVYSCLSCGRYVCFDCKMPRSRCSFCGGMLRVFPVSCPSCHLEYLSPLELANQMRCPSCHRKCRPIGKG